jgi:hypothetical protein
MRAFPIASLLLRAPTCPMARRSFIAPRSFVVSGGAIHNCAATSKIYGEYFAPPRVCLSFDPKRSFKVLKLSCNVCGTIGHNTENCAAH